MEKLMDDLHRLHASVKRAYFLGRRYVDELGEPVELFSNGFAVMIRAMGDTPNPVENEGETWDYVGLIE